MAAEPSRTGLTGLWIIPDARGRNLVWPRRPTGTPIEVAQREADPFHSVFGPVLDSPSEGIQQCHRILLESHPAITTHFESAQVQKACETLKDLDEDTLENQCKVLIQEYRDRGWFKIPADLDTFVGPQDKIFNRDLEWESSSLLLLALRLEIEKRHPVLALSEIFRRHSQSRGQSSDEEVMGDTAVEVEIADDDRRKPRPSFAQRLRSFAQGVRAVEHGVRYLSRSSLASTATFTTISTLRSERRNESVEIVAEDSWRDPNAWMGTTERLAYPLQDIRERLEINMGSRYSKSVTPNEDELADLSEEQEDINVSTNPSSAVDNPKEFSVVSPFCLDGQITNRSRHVVVCGGYSDIWTARLYGKAVAVKVLRAFNGNSTPDDVKDKLFKRIKREYHAWSSLSHPNIVPFLGFTYDFTYDAPYQPPAFISPWMIQGTASVYIRKNPHADRLRLIIGVAKGLNYLHTLKCPIVHGDLRCCNILIGNDGEPCLSDFGLSRILREGLGFTTSSDLAGSLRWMAPELLEGNKVNQASDIWAYGMTVLEITTGQRPYIEVKVEPAVIRIISIGTLPPRPKLIQAPCMIEAIWRICVECWKFIPTNRLTSSELLFRLSQVG